MKGAAAQVASASGPTATVQQQGTTTDHGHEFLRTALRAV